jgi:hypothetical protein
MAPNAEVGNDEAVGCRLEGPKSSNYCGSVGKTPPQGRPLGSIAIATDGLIQIPESNGLRKEIRDALSNNTPASVISPDLEPVTIPDASQKSSNVAHIALHMGTSKLDEPARSKTTAAWENRVSLTASPVVAPKSVSAMSLDTNTILSKHTIGSTGRPPLSKKKRSSLSKRKPNALATDPPRAQSLSYRQLLQQRLQKYGWSARFDVESKGPQHAQEWRGTFWRGSYMLGQSSWCSRKDAAKEEAAKHALTWMNQYGYEQL